jgi:ectoine hydroxylase-related dioxygenase (phytanoyl-CoA dioxygenase family)
MLAPDRVEFYKSQGYLAPLRCMTAERARWMVDELARCERDRGLSAGSIHFKGHLVFKWSHELACSPELLDPVEALIGPDIMVFASKFWVKGGGDGSFVSWHQDSAYFGLEPHDLVTAWVALTDSHRGNGCLRVIPQSHLGPAQTHAETYDAKNLLARGQEIEGIDDGGAVDLELRAGEFSLHNERTVHGSLANDTDAARIGMALFYIPTHVRSTLARRTACLVRGEDRYGHWDLDPTPRHDFDPVVMELVERARAGYVDPSVAQEAK